MYKPSSSLNLLSSAASRKRNRNRGVILSVQGWQKLTEAGVLYDKFGNRYTYEHLSERSLLNERTVSRILSCEIKVDKRTLKTFFAAFGLHLDKNDYRTSEGHVAGQSVADLTQHLSSNALTTEAHVSYEELFELYQQLMRDLRHLSRLLNLDEMGKGMQL